MLTMCRQLYINPTHVRFKQWAFLAFVFILLVTGCQFGVEFAPRDCHYRANVPVRGKVRDGFTKQPIVGAEILVRSTNSSSKCPYYRPMPDLKLTTDNQGQFNGVIPLMHEDDIAELIVSAPNYKPYRLAPLLDMELRINLDKQATPTPSI